MIYFTLLYTELASNVISTWIKFPQFDIVLRSFIVHCLFHVILFVNQSSLLYISDAYALFYYIGGFISIPYSKQITCLSTNLFVFAI